MDRKHYKIIKPFCSSIEQGNKHIKAKLYNGGIVIISGSGGDNCNEWNNIRRNFKKQGIQLPLK